MKFRHGLLVVNFYLILLPRTLLFENILMRKYNVLNLKSRLFNIRLIIGIPCRICGSNISATYVMPPYRNDKITELQNNGFFIHLHSLN